MRPEFGENAYKDDSASRRAKIRDTFKKGMTIAAHTEYCIDAGFWSKHEIRAKATKGCRDEVRDALGEISPLTGVPFAGPTPLRDPDTKAPLWRQEALWSKEIYFYNYDAYRKRGGADISIANKIAERCRDRFGDGPKSLQVIPIEDEPEGA